MSAESEGGATDRRSADMVPIWLRRAAAFSWRILAIVALAALAIWLAGVLSTVTASIIVAVVVAVTFGPLMRRLLARGR